MRTVNWSRLLAIVALMVLTIPLTVTTPRASADGDDEFPIPEKPALKYPNLGYHLDRLVARVEAGEASGEEAAKDASISQDEAVAVTIYLSGNVVEVVEFLEENGGAPRNVGDDYIEAYVRVSLLGPLSEQPGVLRVREIIPPQDDLGNFTSQGVQAHGSAVWNQGGYSGQDIKVGVIDSYFGFRGFRGLMGSELPASVEARCYPEVGLPTNNLADCEHIELGSAHGTVVAETLMDIAPEVDLYIASPLSSGDLNDAVEWMVSQGVSVIVQSQGHPFDGPGDGSSPFHDSPLRTVDRAVDSGIVWVNSAGNYAMGTWFGPYSNPDNDRFINFMDSIEANSMFLEEGERVSIQLRWDDSWEGATRDLGIYIWNPRTSEFVPGLAADDPQLGASGHVPYEYLRLIARASGTWDVVVFDHGGARVPSWVQLIVHSNAGIEYHTLNGSINNPSESANPGMLAVGAAPWYDVHTIQHYSSRGPTPDGRAKPDIVGADCGETALLPLREQYFGFCGTSQAAPHVAGMAALVRQRFPEKLPVEVAEYLKDHTERRGSVPNSTWGHGFAQLPAHDAVAPTPATVTLSQDTVLANQTLSISGSGFSDSAAGSNRCIEQGNVLINHVPVEIIDLEDSGGCDGAVELTSNGTFALTVVLRREDGRIPDPLLTAGTHAVVITDTKGVEGRAQVTIPARELEAIPNPASPQDQITIRGRNFPANNPDGSDVAVDITYDCGGLVRQTVSAEPDASGIFEGTLPVPNDCGVPSTNTIGVSTSVDGIATVVDTITHDVLPSADTCGETIPSDGTVSGQWASGCTSEVTGRGYARYYTFTLAQESEVTITLESQDADTYLYLRQGEARSGGFLYQNDDDGGTTRSRIQETLAAGTYTIEATTYDEGQTGSFTLAVSGLVATAPPPGPTPSDPCGETLPEDGTVSGRWAAGCQSEVSGRGYARYYSFTLTQQSEVTITLESQDADTYLYLRGGEARSGTALYENDDDGGITRSQIQETLAAGTYTIEVTTYDEGQAGSFTLTVAGLGTTTPVPEPTGPCGETLAGDGTASGQWAEGCQSEVSGRGYARYYGFTLAQQSEVTITLESQDADTYLYLRAGQARSGDYLYENDDDGGTTRSRIQETLAAGTYTIEATTYDEGQTGSFTLTISGLGAVPTAQSCSLGLTLAPGERCSHLDFTIEVDASGTLLMRFAGNRVDLDNLVLVRSGNNWSIESLP